MQSPGCGSESLPNIASLCTAENVTRCRFRYRSTTGPSPGPFHHVDRVTSGVAEGAGLGVAHTFSGSPRRISTGFGILPFGLT
jgi:hypothetical protein